MSKKQSKKSSKKQSKKVTRKDDSKIELIINKIEKLIKFIEKYNTHDVIINKTINNNKLIIFKRRKDCPPCPVFPHLDILNNICNNKYSLHNFSIYFSEYICFCITKNIDTKIEEYNPFSETKGITFSFMNRKTIRKYMSENIKVNKEIKHVMCIDYICSNNKGNTKLINYLGKCLNKDLKVQAIVKDYIQNST